MDHSELATTAIPHEQGEAYWTNLTCKPEITLTRYRVAGAPSRSIVYKCPLAASPSLHGEVPRCRCNRSYSQYGNLFYIAHVLKGLQKVSPISCERTWSTHCMVVREEECFRTRNEDRIFRKSERLHPLWLCFQRVPVHNSSRAQARRIYCLSQKYIHQAASTFVEGSFALTKGTLTKCSLKNQA